jgi:hypothetical protein
MKKTALSASTAIAENVPVLTTAVLGDVEALGEIYICIYIYMHVSIYVRIYVFLYMYIYNVYP